MTDKLEYTLSSGNVYADLELVHSEERLAKAQIVSKILEIAKEKGLTQKKVANLLGIDQPKISALYHGRLSGFSISRLIRFLILLKYDVEIIIKDKSNSLEPLGHLTVLIEKDSPRQLL